MFSFKTFDSLYFNTESGPLTIDDVLNILSSLTPYIDFRDSPKLSVESQNISTLNSELEYDIYSTTPKVRESLDTCLEL
jgi:hypothetical protein